MQYAISKDGTKIAFDKIGNGPALILVDGAFCYRSFGPASKLSALLAGHFTVFTYDRRGRGDSAYTKPYSVQREVDDIEALIKEAGGSAFVFAISSGVALVLHSIEIGLNIKRLAFYEPPFMVDKDGHKPPADSEAQLNNLIATGKKSDAVKFFMVNVMGAPSIIVYMMRLMPFWSKLKAIAHTLPYDAAIMGDFSLPTQKAKLITVPTVVIDGGNSPGSMRRSAEQFAAAIPGAKYVTLVGQTHDVDVKVLAPNLIDFFSHPR